MPVVPRSPRYDGRLGRKGGFCWMSEMTLESLIYWENAKRTSADEGGQYADQNRRTADTLAKWIEWRSIAPDAVWSGTRGEDRATAAPPSREPKLNAWQQRSGGTGKGSDSKTQNTNTQSESYADDDYGD